MSSSKRRRKPRGGFAGPTDFSEPPRSSTSQDEDEKVVPAPNAGIKPATEEEYNIGINTAHQPQAISDADIDDVNALPKKHNQQMNPLDISVLNDELSMGEGSDSHSAEERISEIKDPFSNKQDSSSEIYSSNDIGDRPNNSVDDAFLNLNGEGDEEGNDFLNLDSEGDEDFLNLNSEGEEDFLNLDSEREEKSDNFLSLNNETNGITTGSELEFSDEQTSISNPGTIDEMDSILDQIVNETADKIEEEEEEEDSLLITKQIPASISETDKTPDQVGDEVLDTNLDPAVSVDTDSIDDMMDGNAEEKVEIPSLASSCRRASLAASSYLPIMTPEVGKDAEDEINHALSSFSNLEFGQMGVIRFSMRAYPEFRETAKDWIRARKAGADPDTSSSSKFKKIQLFTRYIGSLLRYHIANSMKPGSGGESPSAPWKKGKDLPPLPTSKVDDEEKQAWKMSIDKARDTTHYETILRIGVIGQEDDQENLDMVVEEAAAGFEVFNSPHQEISWEEGNAQDLMLGMMGARSPDNPSMVLSAREVGGLAHIGDDLMIPHGVNVKRSYFKQLPIANPLRIEDPLNPKNGDIPIGLMNPRSEDEVVIGMNNAELDKHAIVVGKTGSGKSEWMKWLIFGIAKSGFPLVLIDPHGAAAEDVLNSLIINCPERADDIVFCDISDGNHPVALNPLDVVSREMVEPSVKSIQEMLKNPKVGFDKEGAPRATVYAVDALTALCHANLVLEDPNNKCTLLDVLTFFNDPEFRYLCVEFCQNESIRQKYDVDTGTFEQMAEKQQLEHTQTLVRVFSTLSQTESFSAVFYSPANKLDFGQLIADKKIILIRLSRFSHQAELGEFIGSLILPWLLSSMDDWGRKKDEVTGEISGVGCRVIVDEAPTVIGPGSSVTSLLAEARKWDLGMVMLSQFLDQFDNSIIDSALANTASKISMVQDPTKARSVAKAIAAASSRVSPEDIAQLPPYHFYGNVLLPSQGGAITNSGPFSAACMPMLPSGLTSEQIAMREEIKNRSRRLICNDIEFVRSRSRGRIDNLKEALQTKLRDKMQGDYTPPPMFTDEEASETYGWKG